MSRFLLEERGSAAADVALGSTCFLVLEVRFCRKMLWTCASHRTLFLKTFRGVDDRSSMRGVFVERMFFAFSHV